MLPVHDIVDLPAHERRFHRHAGRPSLSLVGTVGERWRRRFERLRTPEDLGAWIAGEDLLGTDPPTCDAADLDAARRLRGVVELLVVAALVDAALDADAVAALDVAAAGPVPVVRLVAAGASQRTAPAGTSDAAAALTLVARDAVAVLGSPLVRGLRECAADDCALVFLDTSRAGARRWCSMRTCGNRAKVRRHRTTG